MFSRFKIFFALMAIFFTACDRTTITEPVDDGLPPTTPVSFNIFSARDGEVGIEWMKNREPDIKHYNVYKSINNPDAFMLIGSTNDEYFIDHYLEYDTTYYYRITAVDIYNRESLPTSPLSARPENYYRPNAPYIIQINARNWNDSLSVHLFWYPVNDTDLLGYEIYRDTIPDFTPDDTKLVGFTSGTEYDDTANLELLIKYNYKILAIDKGMLRSISSGWVSDIILNKPMQVFPQNNTLTDPFGSLRIQTVSQPAFYKIIIQTNPLYGIIHELSFFSDVTDSVISIDFSSTNLESYKKYYWRILAFTESNSDPNSFSDLFNFSINSGL